MNEHEIRLIQTSFEAARPRANELGELFYGRLFQQHPELRPMFPTDIKPQAKKLVGVLAIVVASLDRLGEILPVVQGLGRNHGAYGVKPHHYDQVGATLIWTLDQMMGDLFTSDVRQAWIVAYTTLSEVMMAAADEAASGDRDRAA
jgi:hemoglobin-like flavoprotein